MGKSEKLAFISVTVLLICLLILIVVRVITSKDAVRVYRVSIITDDVQGDYSANVQKGLDRAARDYNIDLQVIALHSGMTTEQQKSSLERELEADTDAIIINLQQNPSLSEQLDLSAISVPIVSLGTVWDGYSSIRSISTDDASMGNLLAQEMIKDGVTVCVIRASLDNTRIRLREAGFVKTMKAAGVAYSSEWDPDTIAWESIPKGAAVAALDEPSLEKLVGMPVAAISPLYGIGYTNALLSSLESGAIRRLIVEDDYAMGYLALQSVVDAIENKGTAHEQILGCYVADAKHLYQEPLQHILFPIS
ncbi:MAG: substrate-binding domain-containing protein [Eubacteriales bacterium]|nr:substrate-binding domain-containing protein [Eubacteriales bacterium]